MWQRTAMGHGIGLRPQHYGRILERGLGTGAGTVDWVEFISENFFEPGGRPWRVLEAVRREVPVVAHGVALGIGNTDPLNSVYLDRLQRLIRRVEPAWVSDHLCWGAFGGHYSHDLLPLPYTEEALAHVVERVLVVQDRLSRQVLLENVSSYVAFVASAMPEWEFLSEVARRADCGILLDLNNVYVSSVNHGFDPAEYIDAVPLDRIGQVHLAGHTDKGSYLLDSHIGPVPQSVWALYDRLLARVHEHTEAVAIPALVEWDEEVPEYEVVVREAEKSRGAEQKAKAPHRRIASASEAQAWS